MPAAERFVQDDFTPAPSPDWKQHLAGSGALEATGSTLLFVNNRTSSRHYANAQIDDYQGLQRRSLHWRAPLRMTVKARFSHRAGELLGTAGFGFWNDPFLMTGRRLPALPRAIWFFYASPPSNMKLALGTSGRGWKAATLDAQRLPFLLLAPTAPAAIPLMNVKPLYRRVWPVAQRALGVSEAALDVPITEWHTYFLEWEEDHSRFGVDGKTVMESESSPGGPLGFVMWLDNQYAVVTPWGKFGYGLLDSTERQWMEVDELYIQPG
jgi:hypothetical protein